VELCLLTSLVPICGGCLWQPDIEQASFQLNWRRASQHSTLFQNQEQKLGSHSGSGYTWVVTKLGGWTGSCNLGMHKNIVLMEMFSKQWLAPRLIYVGLKILIIATLASMRMQKHV
jgi:hypothetical protein